MRRADRLFQIVQYLRARRLTTADWLADRLEVSTRTVYRDINDLTLSGVPIEGEAGVGYVLRKKLDLPPLMFDRNELTAIELGLRFVQGYTERPLSNAGASAMAKIRAALPGTVAESAARSRVYVPRKETAHEPRLFELLTAIDNRNKVQIGYRTAAGAQSERTVWPLGVFFWGAAWTVVAWCELRDDFRSFRLDRINASAVLDARFPDTAGRRLIDYFRWLEETCDVSLNELDPEAP